MAVPNFRAGSVCRVSLGSNLAVREDTRAIEWWDGTTWRQVGGSQTWKPAVDWATTAALPAYTPSGTTILTANAAGALTVDGSAVVAGEFVLVKDEASTQYNGVYVVTTAGSGGSQWRLTRRYDSDQASELKFGHAVAVVRGATNGGTVWMARTAGEPTPHSGSITYSQVGGGGGVSSPVLISHYVGVVSPGPATFTPQAATAVMVVELIGGGGGGGGVAAAGAGASACAGGGASGGVLVEVIFAPVGPYAISVGVGGLAGLAGGGAGGAGGATSFGGLSANGGHGGAFVAAAAGAGFAAGGAAVASIGATAYTAPGATAGINGSGNPGGHGIKLGAAQAIGGHGGCTPVLGGGGYGAINGVPAAGGTANGAGGGGASSIALGAAMAGGAGIDGSIRVWEYA